MVSIPSPPYVASVNIPQNCDSLLKSITSRLLLLLLLTAMMIERVGEEDRGEGGGVIACCTKRMVESQL